MVTRSSPRKGGAAKKKSETTASTTAASASTSTAASTRRVSTRGAARTRSKDDEPANDTDGDDEHEDDSEDEDEYDSEFEKDAAGSGAESDASDASSENAVFLDASDEDEEAEEEAGSEDLSSDEEHQLNTTGNVPMHWYDEFDHIGYDKSGEKIMRGVGMDEVDKAIATADDRDYRRSIYDARNDENITLTDRELVMVKRMLEGKFPHPESNMEPDYIPYYTSIVRETPLPSGHEPKRRFIPSKWERMKVLKIVAGMQAGNIKFKDKSKGENEEDDPRPVYLLWGANDEVDDLSHEGQRRQKGPRHIPAPKRQPPGHAESYHPPAEYLFDEAEKAEWLDNDVQDRKTNFEPKDFQILRRVPAYHNSVKEQFERCLDLYMCTRAEKHRLNIDPESLVPRLPLPRELRPYPTTTAISYRGHYGRVRAIAIDPTGQWLATGGDDMCVKVWEIETARCVRTWKISAGPAAIVDTSPEADDEQKKAAAPAPEDKEAVNKLAWNPARGKHVLACAVGRRVVLLYTGTIVGSGEAAGGESDVELTRAVLYGLSADAKPTEEAEEQGPTTTENEVTAEIEWRTSYPARRGHGKPLLLGEVDTSVEVHFTDTKLRDVVDVQWHIKGDYLATVSAKVNSSGGRVMVHNLPKRKTQAPFTAKVKGDMQKICFHPNRPVFFVATKTHVSVFHLVKQVLMKKLITGLKWISSIAVHPGGDNLVVGSYDKRVAWFDLDLSSKPFRTLKYHTGAVRDVAFHPRYPLLASASDDGSVHVFHARVFDDLMKNPLIVPVKVIKAHGIVDGIGTLACAFHPTQPWLISAGADGAVLLHQNMP